jgi:hypothetical protein
VTGVTGGRDGSTSAGERTGSKAAPVRPSLVKPRASGPMRSLTATERPSPDCRAAARTPARSSPSCSGRLAAAFCVPCRPVVPMISARSRHS